MFLRLLSIPIALLSCVSAFAYTIQIHHSFSGPGSFTMYHASQSTSPQTSCTVSDPTAHYTISFPTPMTALVTVDRPVDLVCSFTAITWIATPEFTPPVSQ